MYIENENVKCITEICIKLMKIFINPKYKTRSLRHNIDEHCTINILGSILDVKYDGKMLFGIREEKIDDAFFSSKDKFEPSDYKVIIRDDSIYISSDYSNYFDKIYTENVDYHYEMIDLPVTDIDMERIKFSLSDNEYLGIQTYYSLQGKIPPAMYIRIEIGNVFNDKVISIADKILRVEL
ncbi:hypothetical protein GNZ01_07170 [Escherichia coli]|uniref:Uncharacterized protein n=1 Tax=Escherichia coli TaxID=562 RepID=A0AAJ2Y350_ECOLX|nr:hypothetical protein [Escherichia coli]MUM71673.1 hypothetical protein [Escherichia coli]MUM83031.1 hypothetical protein [Escherichia coli]